MYTFEDYLKDAQNTSWENKAGDPPTVVLRTNDTRARIWACGDDVLATVADWLYWQLTTRFPSQKHLPTVAGSSPGITTLYAAVEKLKLDDISNIILPYLKTSKPEDAAKLEASMRFKISTQPPNVAL